MRGSRRPWVFVGAVLFVVSCGGGGGQTTDGGAGGTYGGSGGTGGAGGTGAGCSSVSPCGGDIVGTWKVTKTCVTETGDIGATLGSGCTGASASLVYTFTGTLTFGADGTLSSTLAASASFHDIYPSGCAPFGATCAQLQNIAVDAGLTDVCTTDATGICTCDGVQPLTTSNPTGTYSVSGSTLTTVQGGKSSTASYCVQGDMLYEIPTPGDSGVTWSGDVVFTKQ